MDISEVTKILKIDGLDEQAQKEFETALKSLVEERSKEVAASIVNPVIEQTKKELQEQYDTKLSEEKESITSNWSDFIDKIIDEVMVIPEYVYDYAKQGQLYGPIIEQFKIRLAIDENILDSEVKEVLRESHVTIEEYETKINTLTKKNMDLVNDAKEMAGSLYIQEKCSGLSEEYRSKIIGLIVPTSDVKKIDEQFANITSILIKEDKEEHNEVEVLKEDVGSGHKEVKSEEKEEIKESWIDSYQRDMVTSFLKS